MGKSTLTQAGVKRAVLRGEAVTVNGLQFYGLTMDQYEDWQRDKGVLLTRQSTLPVAFITMPFLDALFALEMESLEKTGKLAGIVYSILHVLAMAMRLPENSVESQFIRPVTHQRELKGFYVEQQGDMQNVFIPKETFPQIRQVIAWQQGEEVPDESLNDELLEDEKWIAQRNAGDLDFDLDAMMASVALGARMHLKDAYALSILEFEMLRRAIDREKKYMLCGIAETSGTKWKGGNPHPSWCFDRKKAESGTLTHVSKFEGIAQR